MNRVYGEGTVCAVADRAGFTELSRIRERVGSRGNVIMAAGACRCSRLHRINRTAWIGHRKLRADGWSLALVHMALIAIAKIAREQNTVEVIYRPIESVYRIVGCQIRAPVDLVDQHREIDALVRSRRSWAIIGVRVVWIMA